MYAGAIDARQMISNDPEDGGEGGIRTHEGREPLPVFKTGAFNRSATSPKNSRGSIAAGSARLIRVCTMTNPGYGAAVCRYPKVYASHSSAESIHHAVCTTPQRDYCAHQRRFTRLSIVQHAGFLYTAPLAERAGIAQSVEQLIRNQ